MPELSIPQPDIRVEASADGSELTLLIYDIIGVDFWGDGVSAKAIVKELQSYPKAASIRVRINSAGGDVFDASAINTALTEHAAHVTVEIEGMALSAASFIAMAGDTIRMSENAFFMIHEPWTWSTGDAAQLRKDADLLDKINGQLVHAYAARTGQNEDQVKQWLAEESWFTATEALDAGFVTEVMESKKAVAACGRPDRFRNAPAGVAARFVTRAAAMAQVNSSAPLTKGESMSEETKPTTETEEKSTDATEPITEEQTPPLAEDAGSTDDPQPQVNDRATEGKKFLDAFGEDRGGRYFARGLSFEQAQADYAKDLRAENETLRQKVAATDRGESEPVTFQPPAAGGEGKKDDSFNKLVAAFGGGKDAEARARRVMDMREKRSA
ncbi:MAG: head maturation protease, ClpP-related [Planctomycetota bacterium]